MSLEIPEYWKRIAGLHVEDNGAVGCVFLGLDTTTSVLSCYDCCKFDREVLAVIGQGISGRGKWIPLAYRKQDEDFAKKLMECGVNVLSEACGDNKSVAEVFSREIWQMIRSNRFRVEKGAAEWFAEGRAFNRTDGHVPLEGFPLMGATRHAIEMIAFARPAKMPGSNRPNYPKLAIA